jgi:tetratricopeptide (TPR) repeat protein
MEGTSNRAAFDAFVKGRERFSIASEKALLRSRRCFERAVKLDPHYGRAWGLIAYTYVQWWLNGWSDDPARIKEAKDRANEYACRGVSLDPNDYHTQWMLGFYYLNVGEHDRALRTYRLAMGLNDRNQSLLAEYAEALIYAGRIDEGEKMIRRAMHIPDWHRWDLAWALYFQGRYDEAIEEVGRMSCGPLDDGFINDVRLFLAAAHAQRGDRAETYSPIVCKFLENRGDWTLEKERRSTAFRNPDHEKRWLAGVAKALGSCKPEGKTSRRPPR